jgi:2-phosphosulfolactate phosphatase
MVGGNIQRLNVHCQWGMHGLRAIGGGNIVVIVDVLSFSTATTVAVRSGAMILPCEWNDERAAALAAAEGAELASRRGRGRFTLAPASLREVPDGLRLVLPSPNGSTLAWAAQKLNAVAIVVGCFRNATAVARWASQQGRDVAVVAAGERWDDGTIRFAIEDWLGAGAIISRLPGSRSPEAEAAAASFERLQHSLHEILADCPSGRELVESGYPDDIDLASELDADQVVPLLVGNAFTLAVQ